MSLLSYNSWRQTRLTAPIRRTCWFEKGLCRAVWIVRAESVSFWIINANCAVCIDLGWQSFLLCSLKEIGRLIGVVFCAACAKIRTVISEVLEKGIWISPCLS